MLSWMQTTLNHVLLATDCGNIITDCRLETPLYLHVYCCYISSIDAKKSEKTSELTDICEACTGINIFSIIVSLNIRKLHNI